MVIGNENYDWKELEAVSIPDVISLVRTSKSSESADFP